MPCVRVRFGDSVGIVSVGGPTRKIYAGSRMWHFEMHPYFGPMPIHKRTGNGIDGTKAFWEAVTYWAQQGECIDDAGICLYDRTGLPPIG